MILMNPLQLDLIFNDLPNMYKTQRVNEGDVDGDTW